MDQFGTPLHLQGEERLSLNHHPPPQPSYRSVVPVSVPMADEQEGENIAVSLPFETKAERHTNLKAAGLGAVACPCTLSSVAPSSHS